MTLQVGLTGNIGSGKSTVARLLVEKGAALVDADALAREAARDPEVLRQIEGALGEGLVKDGALNRAATAARVFNDPEARARLNAVIHPWVRRRREREVRALLAQDPPPKLILHDVPLLYETGLQRDFGAVIVVDAPLDVRVGRVAARSGLSEAEVRARDAAQMPLEEKVRRADFVIENGGDLASLKAQVNDVWQQLTAQHAPYSPLNERGE